MSDLIEHAYLVIKHTLEQLDETAGGIVRREVVTRSFRLAKRLWSRDDGGELARGRQPSIYALIDPWTISNTFELGLYLKSAFSLGSKAPYHLSDRFCCRHVLAVVERDVEFVARNPGAIVDMLPQLLTFASGLFSTVRMANGMEASLQIDLLEVGSAIVNASILPVLERRPPRIPHPDFTTDDLVRLYHDCRFSHGIAIRAVRDRTGIMPASSFQLLDHQSYLDVAPSASGLLHQWQLTQRARDEIATLDFQDRSGALSRARKVVGNINFKSENADRWTQGLLKVNDPARTVEAELAAAQATTSMVDGLLWTIRMIHDGGVQRTSRTEIASHIASMNKLAMASSAIWWHSYAHCKLLEAVSVLATSQGRFRRKAYQARALTLLQDAEDILLETNDLGMAARTGSLISNLLEEGFSTITAHQADHLFFGRSLEERQEVH